ncbi:MAG: hypothetical protein KC477_17320, partial [Oceanospirillaceae bacterium]|nr:hypothetical protein [Oceanospirillaceae bacterium]
IGVALVQAGSGWLLEWAIAEQFSTIDRYRMLFITLLTTMAIATLIYCLSNRQGRADEPVSIVSAHGEKAVSGILRHLK